MHEEEGDGRGDEDGGEVQLLGSQVGAAATCLAFTLEHFPPLYKISNDEILKHNFQCFH